jgi:hypothetical protein
LDEVVDREAGPGDQRAQRGAVAAEAARKRCADFRIGKMALGRAYAGLVDLGGGFALRQRGNPLRAMAPLFTSWSPRL